MSDEIAEAPLRPETTGSVVIGHLFPPNINQYKYESVVEVKFEVIKLFKTTYFILSNLPN